MRGPALASGLAVAGHGGPTDNPIDNPIDKGTAEKRLPWILCVAVAAEFIGHFGLIQTSSRDDHHPDHRRRRIGDTR